MPLPDVHSNRYFETCVVELTMEDILDAFLGLRLSNLKGWIYYANTSFFIHTIWTLFLSIICYMPHKNIAACICMFCYCNYRKREKQYVGHSTSLLPGMISTVFNTESLFAGSVLDTCFLPFFSVLSLPKSGWPSHTLSLSWDC